MKLNKYLANSEILIVNIRMQGIFALHENFDAYKSPKKYLFKNHNINVKKINIETSQA